MSVQTIAVVGAMEQEIELLRESMANVKHVSFGKFSAYEGELAGKRMVLVLSGIIMLFIFNYGLPVWIIAKTVLLIGYIVFSAKFFSKKQLQNQPHFFFLALVLLIATILIGYFH